MDLRDKLAGLIFHPKETFENMSDDFVESMVKAVENAQGKGVTLSPALEKALQDAPKDGEKGADIFRGQIVANAQGQISLLEPPEQNMFIVNSFTSGKHRTESIDGQDHLVTNIMSIAGDTVMNGIHYGLQVVKESHTQLNDLPAPVGHPLINGVPASASHPRALNKNGIGAFIRKPKMVGAKVFNELVIPLNKALADDKGVEVVNRIKTGKRLGVSTGGHAKIKNESGTARGDGRRYSKNAEKIIWNHVALLPDIEAAGEHAGTRVINADDGELVYVCNVDATQLEDDNPMTIEEQIENVKKEGHTVILKDAPELKKLNITNEQLGAVEAMEAEKLTALNSAKETLAKALDKKPEEIEGSIEVINATIEALNKPPTDHSAAAGGSADETPKGKATAETVQNEFDKIMNPKEKKKEDK